MPYPAFLEKWDKDKKLREKYGDCLAYFKRRLPSKIIITIIFFLFLYILLPIYLLTAFGRYSPASLLSFYFVNTLIILYLLKKNANRKYHLRSQIQHLEEELNILNAQGSGESKKNADLQTKITRYGNLKKIVEEINENLDLDSVANNLVSAVFSLISNNKGVSLLYLVDNQTQKLSLFKTKKEDRNLIIKTKEGDIFDLWVLRHTNPLLIEDIKRDFRFDAEKLRLQDLRPLSSLVSSPFVSEERFLGILRLDNPQPYFYSQDDLRFLVAICELGAVALENSELFQETQDLAIHDGLTSLYTKEYFLERLKEERKRCISGRTILSLLMIDIDYFKNYNDKFGHIAGDIVLKKISQDITDSLKELNSIAGRFGGEEFCVILPGIDKEKAFHFASGLRERIEKEKLILRRHETNVTVSIGVAAFPVDANQEDELIMKADRAMYEAKQKGRNRVCCI